MIALAKVKVFKCPRCGTLLTFKLELPKDVKRWPFIMKAAHKTSDGKNCVIAVGIDPNYDIRELAREDMIQ